MKYNVTLLASETVTGNQNPVSEVALKELTLELEATNVKEVRALARAQNPGSVVKKVRRQKQTTAA